MNSHNNNDNAKAQLKRRELTTALNERGMVGALHLVDGMDDDEVAAAFPAIAAYDKSRGEKTPGLLVYLIRSGVPTPPTGPDPKPLRRDPSPRLLQSVRGSCYSPDGFDRGEARGMFADAAKRHGLTVDELIDAAMGVDWTQTPPHPARDRSNPHRAEDYERWVAGELANAPAAPSRPGAGLPHEGRQP